MPCSTCTAAAHRHAAASALVEPSEFNVPVPHDPAPAPAPAVHVNQVGYLPHGPKRATLVADPTAPVPFRVRDAAGAVVLEAMSQPAPAVPDATSGLPVHVLDFTSLEAPGQGYTVEAAGSTSPPFAVSVEPYRRLRRDALAFFYAQRSGIEIRDDVLPGYARPAGHLGVPPNRGDTEVGCWTGEVAESVYGGPWSCDLVVDASGGWYDAGDHGKYVVNGGIAVAQLMSAYERTLHAPNASPQTFADGTLAVPERGNGVPDLLDEVRWELEWLLRMQVPAGDPLAGLAFHKLHDEAWVPLPVYPHEDPQPRVLHRPSTAATLNLAAAAAQGARLFRPYDADFAERLLAAARTAHAAARRVPDLYAPADAAHGGGPYDDTDVTDELYWAAAELYLTTGEQEFLDTVTASPWHEGEAFDLDGFDWGHTAALGRLDLATVPSALPDRERVRASVLAAADRLLALQAQQPWDQPYAPRDLRWVWGSCSQVLNNVVVLATAADLSGEQRYRDGALRGVDLVLGRNALGLSFVTGYGTAFAHHQHHRHFAHSLDPTMPPPPPGSLAGGPNSNDPDGEARDLTGLPPQLAYVDDVRSYATNEVAINWNSALAWVAAWVADQG